MAAAGAGLPGGTAFYQYRGPSGSELTPRVAWPPAVPQAGPWPGCLSLPVERSVLLQVEPIYWNFGPSAANVGVLR